MDLGPLSICAFWIDVANIYVSGGSVQIVFETSPTRDDAYFQPVIPPVTLTAASTAVPATPIVAKAVLAPGCVPPARWLRWRLVLAGGSSAQVWGATFRVHVGSSSATSSTPFVPTMLGSCALWLRSDLGIQLTSGTVSQWNDQSGSNDVNKNLTAAAANQPGYAQYNTYGIAAATGISGVSFGTPNAQSYMNGGSNGNLWASVLPQPCYWFVVADLTSGAGNATYYIMDGHDTGGHGQVISCNPVTPVTTEGAGGSAFNSGTAVATTGSGIVAVYNGASSALYVNNFTIPSVGTVGAGTGSQASISLGAHSDYFGGGNWWLGNIFEVAAFSGSPTATQLGLLRQYANGRYGLQVQ